MLMPSPMPPHDPPTSWTCEPRQLRLSVAGLGPDPFFDAPIYRQLFCVGRSTQAQGFLADPERRLSCRHFEVELRTARHRLRNLSINGTILNGTLLKDDPAEQVLKDGDVIQAGAYTITVHFQHSPFAALSEGADSWLAKLRTTEPKQDEPY